MSSLSWYLTDGMFRDKEKIFGKKRNGFSLQEEAQNSQSIQRNVTN